MSNEKETQPEGQPWPTRDRKWASMSEQLDIRSLTVTAGASTPSESKPGAKTPRNRRLQAALSIPGDNGAPEAAACAV